MRRPESITLGKLRHLDRAKRGLHFGYQSMTNILMDC